MALALARRPVQPMVPVMRQQQIVAWPPKDEGKPASRIDYQTLESALTTEHNTDAHTAAYSVPAQPNRLRVGAPELLNGGGVFMALAIFDIDGPGHAASDDWWGDQGENLARLNEVVPGLYVYRTRGGYRIVGRLGLPFGIRTAEDANNWTEIYLTWCAWLWRCFEIKADPVGDWQRLYRLPIVKRDGETVRYKTLGDPANVGIWQCKPSGADIETAKGLRRKPEKTKGPTKARAVTTDYTGSGILVRVLQNRGDLGTEVSRGMWAARCPLATEHSSGTDFDTSTVVFAPTNHGDSLGWIDCKHTNCGHSDKTVKEWLRCFDQTELDRAREQLGIPVQKQQPKPDNDDYQHTDDDAPGSELAYETSGMGGDPVAPRPLIELVRIGDLVGPALDRAVRRRDRIDLPVPVPFREWAEALGGGLWPGSHHIVSGTGVGKSQLTIETALKAAMSGIPVVYIGLELDQMQIALRVLGEQSHQRWSSLYLGQFNDHELERARGAANALGNIPFYCDFGPPRGWPVSRLEELARSVRQKHPTGPLLMVLDYLQLVSDDPGLQRRMELREKIGNAAYQTKAIASAYDASVLVVSSAARSHYGLLASDAKEAGLITRKGHGHVEPIKMVAHPHVLMGLGKESGDVEFAADTVTTLIRWPAPLDNGETAIIAAVPKVRAGIPRWFALSFSGRFTEMPIQSIDELPQGEKEGRPAIAPADLASRLLATLHKLGPGKRRREIVDQTTGDDRTLYRILKTLVVDGKILVERDGTLTAVDAVTGEAAQQ